MATKTTHKPSSPSTPKAPKVDQYEAITSKMVEALEAMLAGDLVKAPWLRPWTGGKGAHNGHTGYVYKGINRLLTMLAGFADPRWYTFNQVASNYGKSHVRKGEKGTHIVKWLPVTKTLKEQDDQGNEVERQSSRMILRAYVVFNHEQIEWEEGKEPKLPVVEAVDSVTKYQAAQALADRSGAKINYGGDRACYIGALDCIQMPAPARFKTVEDFWGTLLHELGHWTGHSTRLKRDLTGRFGSESYAMEELVAELGSAFLCADLGIEGKLQHTSYILHWVDVLKRDKYAIFTASRLAQEVVGFLDGQSSPGDTADVESEKGQGETECLAAA